MEGRLPNGSLLKKVFEAVREMVSDVNLECSDQGMQIQAMDASHVSLVSLDLKPHAFDQWSCSRVRTLGLNMSHVAKVFKLCGNDDHVIIRNEEDAETVMFVFETPGEDRVSDFELRLMQIDQEHMGVPDSEFASTTVMPSKHFARVVADLGQFSDTIQIEVSPKGIKFTAKGDVGSGNTTYKARSNDNEKVEVTTSTTTTLMFATRYLSYFTKAASVSDFVQLRMSPGQPLEVTYVLNNDANVGTLRFYLAPKMDEIMATE